MSWWPRRLQAGLPLVAQVMMPAVPALSWHQRQGISVCPKWPDVSDAYQKNAPPARQVSNSSIDGPSGTFCPGKARQMAFCRNWRAGADTRL